MHACFTKLNLGFGPIDLTTKTFAKQWHNTNKHYMEQCRIQETGKGVPNYRAQSARS